jgi:hypothetical protein
MIFRIAISVAAVTVGIFCIATNASAGFGGFHFGGLGGLHQGGVFRGANMGHVGGFGGFPQRGVFRGVQPGRRTLSGKSRDSVTVFQSAGGASSFSAGGAGGGGGGTAVAAQSFYGRNACGRYPYPPCRRN